jgi:hypothetical protein
VDIDFYFGAYTEFSRNSMVAARNIKILPFHRVGKRGICDIDLPHLFIGFDAILVAVRMILESQLAVSFGDLLSFGIGKNAQYFIMVLFGLHCHALFHPHVIRIMPYGRLK